MAEETRYADLVSLACHDLSTPLATVSGFAGTLARSGLDEPAGRYVEMIVAASGQIEELLLQLSLATRIERGGYRPRLEDVDSLALAQAVADDLGEDRVRVSGEGALVRVEVERDATRRGLTQLARAAARHGGHDSVGLAVRGTELEVSPVTRASAPVLLGEDLRDLGPAVAGILIRHLGGSLEVQEEGLLIRLPAPA